MWSATGLCLVVGLATAAPTAHRSGRAPGTQLGIELSMARVRLLQLQTLYQPEHASVLQQQDRVLDLEKAVARLRDRGHEVDQVEIDEYLDLVLIRAEARLQEARRQLTESHPRLSLMEVELEALQYVIARRVLVE